MDSGINCPVQTGEEVFGEDLIPGSASVVSGLSMLSSLVPINFEAWFVSV